MTHTKGPWFHKNGNEVHNIEAKRDKSGTRIGDTPARICDVEYPFDSEEGRSDNARLIAAAPDLLEACELLLEFEDDFPEELWSDEYRDAIHAAKYAVAKAEGERNG
jgi:hypothetical protein